MQIQTKTYWGREFGDPESVADAVEGKCRDDLGHHDSGALESVQYGVRATQTLIGRLVSTLADKGLLTVEDLGKILDIEVRMIGRAP